MDLIQKNKRTANMTKQLGLTGIQTPKSATQGWWQAEGARKWHYYKGRIPVCGAGYPIKADPVLGYELGNNDSPSNCKACQKVINRTGE